MLNTSQFVPAFWYMSDNFGDSLSYYLAKKISQKPVVFVDRDSEQDKAVITGSILNNEITNAYVWGAGVAWKDDKIPQHKKICAVRGKLSGQLCEEQGIEHDKVYGDPALLLPRFFRPQYQHKYKLGLVPHYVDMQHVIEKIGRNGKTLEEAGIKIINILDGVESVITQLLSCTQIISSSLHGLIAAHAYGLPAAWGKFADNIIGDDFKYFDYYSTTNKAGTTDFVDLRGDELSFESIKNIADYIKFEKTWATVNLDDLYNACPFK